MRYSRSSGFTLIELMIVIAIVGILASIAVPQYNTYRKRSSFTEVVLATANIKKAAEVAVQTGRVTNLSQLNSNSNGIPPDITSGTSVGQFVESVTLSAGTLTATSTAALDNTTYTLSASLANGGILWVADTSAASACQKSGLC